MKHKILFLGKNKKHVIKLSSSENDQRVVQVKGNGYTFMGNNS